MKILILGANGNLGGQLKKVFLNEENEVITWDKDDVDIIDRELIQQKILDVKPDILINTAAYNAVDLCEENEEEFEIAKKINGLAPGYLADACLEINCLFLHYSSDYVFGNTVRDLKEIKKQGGFKESDQPMPINKYGETKYLGEKEIISRSGKGLKYYLIRTAKLFGPRGEDLNSKPCFFDIMLDLASKNEKLRVVDDEKSCFTYTPDLAVASKELIEADKPFGIYHLVNEVPATWFEGAKKLMSIINSDIVVEAIKSEDLNRKAKRPSYSVLKNTKFKALRSYEDCLLEYYGNK